MYHVSSPGLYLLARYNLLKVIPIEADPVATTKVPVVSAVAKALVAIVVVSAEAVVASEEAVADHQARQPCSSMAFLKAPLKKK